MRVGVLDINKGKERLKERGWYCGYTHIVEVDMLTYSTAYSTPMREYLVCWSWASMEVV